MMSTIENAMDLTEQQPRIGFGAIFWLVMLAAPLPVVLVYLHRMCQMPHYGYFPFLLVAVAYLAVTRGVGAWQLPTRWTIGAAVLAGQSVALAGAVVTSPWLAVIGWIVVIMAALANRAGRQTRHLLYLGLPLILLVRLPMGWDHMLVIELQNWTTRLTSVMLDLLSVPHLVKNNTVTLVSGELLVAEACSGIQSVFTLSFIATMFVVWNRRPWWTMPIYLGAAVVLAVAGNVLRVTTIAVFQHNGWTDLSEGLAHAGLGYLVLGIAAALLLSFDCLVAAVFPSLDPNAPVPLAYARFFKDNQMGDLFYGAVDATGNIVSPPARMGQLEGRLALLIDPTPDNTPMAMIQVWRSGPGKLSPEAVDAMRRAASTLLRRSSGAIRGAATPGGQGS